MIIPQPSLTRIAAAMPVNPPANRLPLVIIVAGGGYRDRVHRFPLVEVKARLTMCPFGWLVSRKKT